MADHTPKPAPIVVDAAMLADLRARLAATRWPEPAPHAGWAYGLDIAELRDLCAYWQTGYDWAAAVAQVNRWPLFTAPVDGVDIHFWHIRSPRSDARPLLLLHGWPGSIVEFIDLLGPLSDPAAHGDPDAEAFDLVVPSIPGFGFGGKPQQAGWNAVRIAAAFDRLMTQTLGYPRYLVQGGDWGSIIAAAMGRAHAANIIAMHLNMPFCDPPPGTAMDPAMGARLYAETGYLHLQNTRSDALTMAQSDSPAGLAGWILDKFRSWSDCKGDVIGHFGRDRLLTNIMFYWAPNSIASATRLYREQAIAGLAPFGLPRVQVPTAFAVFPAEPYRVPRAWLEHIYPVTRYTPMAAGGHFAAMEQPDLLIADMRAAFARH